MWSLVAKDAEQFGADVPTDDAQLLAWVRLHLHLGLVLHHPPCLRAVLLEHVLLPRPPLLADRSVDEAVDLVDVALDGPSILFGLLDA